MGLDRSGPFEVFQRHLHQIAGEMPNESGPAPAHISPPNLGSAFFYAGFDSFAWRDERQKILGWLDRGLWTSMNASKLDIALFDVAGVCLVSALVRTAKLAELIGPRQMRRVLAAVQGAISGYEGQSGMDGAMAAFDGYIREQVAAKGPSAYRNLLLASLSRLHVQHGLNSEVVEEATRRCARGNLADIARIKTPGNYPIRGPMSLGELVGELEWHMRLRADVARAPKWDPEYVTWLRKGKFDPVLGLD